MQHEHGIQGVKSSSGPEGDQTALIESKPNLR